jgi:hypothetical protein
MRGKKATMIRQLLSKPNAELLVLIHNVYGDETKNMEYKQVYKATKALYKKGLIKFKKEKSWANSRQPEILIPKNVTG